MAAKASRAPLSRERVLAAAVALVDGHGLPALTMRRLAVDLGVEAMSLYYHLPGKEGLLDGLVETVVDEIDAAVGRLAGRRRRLAGGPAPAVPGRPRGHAAPPVGARADRHPPDRARPACTCTTTQILGTLIGGRVLLPPRAPGAARVRQHAARLRPGGVQPGRGRRQHGRRGHRGRAWPRWPRPCRT